MRREPLPQLGASGAEGRTIPVGNQIVDGEILAMRLEPAQHGTNILIPLVGLYGTKKCVLENPIETRGSGVVEEISQAKPRPQAGGFGSFVCQSNRARRDVVPKRLEVGTCPSSNVMSSAASRHTNCAARQIRMLRQEVHQPRRGRALFPWHVFCQVTRLPNFGTAVG